jgi:hypothetical protein
VVRANWQIGKEIGMPDFSDVQVLHDINLDLPRYVFKRAYVFLPLSLLVALART